MNNLKMNGKNILYGTGLYLLSLWALYGKKIINIEETAASPEERARSYSRGMTTPGRLKAIREQYGGGYRR